MAEAATDVGQRGGFVQPPACGHEVEEIAVPPEVTLRAEPFRRMGLVRFFAGWLHDGSFMQSCRMAKEFCYDLNCLVIRTTGNDRPLGMGTSYRSMTA